MATEDQVSDCPRITITIGGKGRQRIMEEQAASLPRMTYEIAGLTPPLQQYPINLPGAGSSAPPQVPFKNKAQQQAPENEAGP